MLHGRPRGTAAPRQTGVPELPSSEAQPGDGAAGSAEAPQAQLTLALAGEFWRKTLNVQEFTVSLVHLPVGRTYSYSLPLRSVCVGSLVLYPLGPAGHSRRCSGAECVRLASGFLGFLHQKQVSHGRLAFSSDTNPALFFTFYSLTHVEFLFQSEVRNI